MPTLTNRPFNSRHAKVVVHGVDISLETSSAEIDFATDQEEATGFQATAKRYVATGVQGEIMQKGFVTMGESGTLEALHGAVNATDRIVSVAVGTTDANCAVYSVQGTGAAEMKIALATGSIATLDGKWHAGTGIVRGYRLADQAVTATGPLAVCDMESAGSGGGFAHIHLTAATGLAGSVTVAVESAADSGFASPTNHGTVMLSAATKAGALAMSGVIGRYVRLNVTGLGGATSINLFGVVGTHNVTY